MNFLEVKEGMNIEYIGDSLAFEGIYQVVSAESTYRDKSKCPANEKGKLLIIEFMNDGTPMFFHLDHLNPAEWRLSEGENR